MPSLKVVGGAYGKRKDLIYEMISYTQSTLGAVRNKSFSTADFRESVFRFNISSALIHFIGIFWEYPKVCVNLQTDVR